MRQLFIRLWLGFWLFCAAFGVAQAQQSAAEISAEAEDDQGFITRFLQEKLSGAGRQVTLTGFDGALSSRATFTRLTISDDDGAWITLENGAIQWTRSALFARRVEISELSAERVVLERLPSGEADAPTPEAREFSLPELPLGINIANITIDRVELGQSVIGIEAALAVKGLMNLSGGEGQTQLDITRVDGPRGAFRLDAAFSNATRVLNLDLDLDEDADGIFVNLVKLHDRPSVQAKIVGQGPLSEFAADLELATDRQERVRGRVALRSAEQDGLPGTAFEAQLGGDISAIVPPEHRDFFGADSQLRAEGWRGQGGQLHVPVLSVETNALNLSGSVATTDQGAPQSAELLLNLGEDANAPIVPVRVPWADKPTTVRSGTLRLSYDAAQDAGWTLRGRVGDVARAEGQLSELRIGGRGRVNLAEGLLESIRGWVAFGMDGILPADENLAGAIGDNLNGGLNFDFRPGNAVEFFGMNINGTEYGFKGDMLVDGLSSGITLSGDLTMGHRNLGRLSGLADRELSGQADARFRGYYVLLSGIFDIDAEVLGTDITVDQPHADRLLAGSSVIRVDARRDETGLEIAELTVNARNLSAEASGYLNSRDSDVRARISMPDLSVADPGMSGSVESLAVLSGPARARRLQITGEAQDLVTGIADLDGALKGRTELAATASETRDGFELQSLSLTNPQLSLGGRGNFAPGVLDAMLDFEMADLAVLGRGFSGGIKASAKASETAGIRRIELEGTGDDLRFGQQDVDGALMGDTRLDLIAEEQGGNITLRDFTLTNAQMNATAQGMFGEDATDLTAQVAIRSLAAFGRGWRGGLDAQGTLADDGQGGRVLDLTGVGRDLALGQGQVDGALAGETRLALRGTERDGVFAIETAAVDNPRLHLDATGQIGGGATDLMTRLNAQDLRFLGRGFRGAVEAEGHITETEGQHHAQIQSTANGLAVGNPQADAILAGQTMIDASIALDPEGRLGIQRFRATNPQLQISADGDPSLLNLTARLADLALIQPGFPGPVDLRGTIGQSSESFQVNVDLDAPGGTQARITGTAARNFATMDMAISGQGDAAVANPFLRTRSVEGPISFDLRLNGPPGIEALSGQLQLNDARLAEPRLGLSIEALSATADLGGGQIGVNLRGEVESGGVVTVSGPISMIGQREMNLDVMLDRVVLRDPNLYEVLVNGALSVTGGLVQGPLVSGRIDVDEAELRIPSTGFGGAASIPPIQHLFDRPPVRATRAKAGLVDFPSEESRMAGMNGPAATPPANPARFDLLISAPRQVFVRGRGVDAELGGELRLNGDARQPIPVGQLELIRGRVDLLGKRFDLTEGLIEMQGSLVPVLRLVAETEQDGILTRIIIDGEARDPDISFESVPDMPEEEVLSHLLFRRGLDRISPLQAAQLANAIAVLAGRGGEGVVGRLRSATGLDDLDLATDDEGNVSVRAGKYLSRNLYTDVQVGADGTTRLNLNLDVTRNLTARGSVDSEGDSTIGIYFDRDY